jgi:hypothetical protein
MTHPVGTKKPNPWGIYDTMGNVLEWCRDAWVGQHPGGEDPEVTEAGLPSRPGESETPFWVCRGGGWFIPPNMTPRVRVRLGSGDQSYLLGFRVAIVRSNTEGSQEESHPEERALAQEQSPLQEGGEGRRGQWVSSFAFYTSGPAPTRGIGPEASAAKSKSLPHVHGEWVRIS